MFDSNIVYRSYRQRVIQNNKELVYQANGGFTFFVPVEEGFKVRLDYKFKEIMKFRCKPHDIYSNYSICLCKSSQNSNMNSS